MRKFKLNDGAHRREYTSAGSDPTVIVHWTLALANGSITTTEFQGIIQGKHTLRAPVPGVSDFTADMPDSSAEAIHRALEAQYADKMAEEHGDTYATWRGAAEDAAEHITKLTAALKAMLAKHGVACHCEACADAEALVLEP